MPSNDLESCACVASCTPDGTATQYIFAGGERIASRITGGAPPPPPSPPSPPPPVLVLPAAAASTTLYYHGDHLGSSSVITDADGRPQQRLAYMPYGATQANSGTLDVRHKYTGQEMDAEIGLYFYNARYYDPVLGRFTQADTIVPNPANPQTLNRYSYALNNPMRYTDPTGHLSEGDLGPGLQFDPAYYTQTPDPSSSFLSANFTAANPYGLDLNVPDLTIDTSFAPLPTASDITATSTGLNPGQMDSSGAGQSQVGSGSASGTAPPWASDPVIAAELNKAWIESNPEAPSVPYGTAGSLKVEQGGWVTEGWFSGNLDVVRVSPGTRDSLPAIVRSRPSILCLCTVKGWFHTHPNTAVEGYLPFIASPADLNFTLNYARVPGVIKTPGPDVYIPYP